MLFVNDRHSLYVATKLNPTYVIAVNTFRTGRHFISFWLLNVADREPIIWLLRHAVFQSTIHCSGAMFLAVSKHDLTVFLFDSKRKCLCS
jgi:hypothetical protein